MAAVIYLIAILAGVLVSTITFLVIACSCRCPARSPMTGS